MTLNPVQQFVLDLSNAHLDSDESPYQKWAVDAFASMRAFVAYVTQVEGACILALEGLERQFGPEAIAVQNVHKHLDAIRAPKPVDPDLAEAREIVAVWYEANPKAGVGSRAPSAIRSGNNDELPEIQQALTALKRGRELASAG